MLELTHQPPGKPSGAKRQPGTLPGQRGPSPARRLALEILKRVEEKGAYSNYLLRAVLDERPISDADRRLVTELVYGVLAHRPYLAYAVSQYAKHPERLPADVRRILYLAFYQLLFLTRIPPYAVLSETLALVDAVGFTPLKKVVNGILRTYLREPERVRLPEGGDPEALSLRYGVPLWLLEVWRERYGDEELRRLLATLDVPPPLSFRVNLLQVDRESVRQSLIEKGYKVEYGRLVPEALRLKGRGFPPRELLDGGWITIQDEAAMFVVHVLDPRPGERILDCCSAPGGKATFAAERMRDVGEVVALDVHESRVRRIREEVGRLGLSIVVPTLRDGRDLPRVYGREFDRVLVDAPCSGLGTIRRRPELRYRHTPESVKELAALQRELLHAAAQIVRPGGVLVYSTCTLTPEENEGVVRDALARNPALELDEEGMASFVPAVLRKRIRIPGTLEILPQDLDVDGFFIARFRVR